MNRFVVFLILQFVVVAGYSSSIRKTAITTDPFGNTFITGSFSGTIDFGKPGTPAVHVTGYGVFVAKYTKAGNCEWVKKADGSSYSYGSNGIVTDTAGNVYITGAFVSSLSFDGKLLWSKGGTDCFVAKYKANGELAWAGRAGSTKADQGSGITISPKGELFVVGSFRGTSNVLSGDMSYATFENEGKTKVLVSNGASSDIFIAKYNPQTGEIIRLEKDGGPGEEFATDIKVTNTGIFVSGNFLDKAVLGSKTIKSYGAMDGFIARYNLSDYALVYVRQIGGNANQVVNSIGYVDTLNNVYVLGSFEGTSVVETSTPQYTSKGNQDIFIAKYNDEGVIQWINTAGGPQADRGSFIGLDELSNVYIQGEVKGPVSFSSVNNATLGYTPDKVNLFLAKYNIDGGLEWVKEAPGAELESKNKLWTYKTTEPISADASGLITSTNFEKPVEEPATAVAVNTVSDNLLSIHPNPSPDGMFNFQYYQKGSSSALIQVFNHDGKVILYEEVKSFSILLDKSLDLRKQPKGIYLLEIVTDKATVKKKLEIK